MSESSLTCFSKSKEGEAILDYIHKAEITQL
jgi:hypothetical protein